MGFWPTWNHYNAATKSRGFPTFATTLNSFIGIIHSTENKAKEVRHPQILLISVVSKTKNSKTKTEARSTQISKTKHPKFENRAPKTRNLSVL